MNREVGVITEQGDLGLGFDPVSEEEREKIDESLNSDQEDNQ